MKTLFVSQNSMQKHPVFQKLIRIFLITLILFTTLTTLPSKATADEYDANKSANCRFVVFGTCQSEGNKGVVVDNDNKNPKEKNLAGANLSGKNLSNANLSGADFSKAKLSEANFSGADLSGATLTGANLKGVNLSGADLSSTKFTKQDLIALIQANLIGGGWFQAAPTLTKQDLFEFIEPDLHQLIRSEDNLSNANMSGANLSKANLMGANFQGAKMGGVDLTGADLTGAKMPNGKIYKP